jgi:hypothetical protein
VCRFLIEDLGFAGLRFDFSKGYGGKYAGIYARAALGDDIGLAVGEYWVPLKYEGSRQLYDQDKNRKELAKWVDETGGRCLAFDFTTKGVLQVRACCCAHTLQRLCMSSPIHSACIRACVASLPARACSGKVCAMMQLCPGGHTLPQVQLPRRQEQPAARPHRHATRGRGDLH